MKKRNFKVLSLKKYSISNLNLLTNYGGNDEETNTAFTTVPGMPTMVTCDDTYTCPTINPDICQTTRTAADNTFEETCDCVGLASLGC
ncbi:hypothetical protein [Kordia jejudonensis]|uniref:hypothetical protein n=1 Tax=Kordia jejudonensis TaxID=1348245 RepID=UPI000629AB72|nr:hypothetical protein [Kordia jejudonensis]